MQSIGVVGESILFLQLSNDHFVLRNSGLRFIFFDAGGLVLLITALSLVWTSNRSLSQHDKIQVV